MNLNRFLEKYSVSNKPNDRKKEIKNEIYLGTEKEIRGYISRVPDDHLCHEYLKGTEEIESNDKLKLPYQARQVFTRWTHSYPKAKRIRSKTFYIKYDQKLSIVDKVMLNNFQNKYFYHIIDDVLYSLKSNPTQRDNILSIVYSPVLYLQNNFSIDFFDIWINEIYINQESKVNKFLAEDTSNLEPFSYITIKLFYTTKPPVKKPEPLW